MLLATIAACAVSAALPITLIHNHDHIAFGSDAQAMSLLAGCALAMWMSTRPESRTIRSAAPMGLAWIIVVAWLHGSWFRVDDQILALVTVAIIWATSQGEETTFLDLSWLRLVGQRSYGLYLWHLPIFFLLSIQCSAPLWIIAVLGVPISWAVTTLSWHYVERPFMRPRHPAPAGHAAVATSGGV